MKYPRKVFANSPAYRRGKCLLFTNCLSLVLLFISPAGAIACKELTVGANEDNPPISYIKDGKMAGVGIDLFKKLTADLKVSVSVLSPTPWARVRYWASIGKVDVLIGISKSEENREHLDFIEPFFTQKAWSVFLRKETRYSVRKLDDLKPLAGGVTLDAKFDTAFSEYSDKYLHLFPVKTVDQNIRKLTFKRLDYIIAPLLPTIHLMDSHYPESLERITFMSDPVSVTDEYIAISKQSPCHALKEKIHARLVAVKASGEFDEWLGESLSNWQALDWYMKNRE